MMAEYSVQEILTIANHLDAVDATRASLVKALMAYRCIRTVDEDGEPLPLVDALSPGEGGTIQPGTEEIEYLAEYLADELQGPPAQAAQVDVYEAYKSWPSDIRKKISMHDLRRMGGWASKAPLKDWRLDTSAGDPILCYQNCSVIESEQARYVFSLIAADQATNPHSPDAADSGRVTPEMMDWLIAYQSRLIVNGLHPEDARLWMKSHEFKDFDYSASAVDEADAAWNDHFANPDYNGHVGFRLSQAFVDRVTQDASGEPPVMGATIAAQGQSAASPVVVPDGWISDPDTIPNTLIDACRDAICREFGNNGTDGYYKRILAKVFAALAVAPQPGESHE